MKFQFLKECWFWFLIITALLLLFGIFIIKYFCINAEWIAIVVALFLGFAATFRDWIIFCFKRPKLKISIMNKPPDCHKAAHRNIQTGSFEHHSYYMRFKVENIGNYHMEDVEAMIAEIEEKGPNNHYTAKNDFSPLNLVWSFYRTITMPKIQPKFFKHCDLCHIVRADDAHLEIFGRTKSSNLVILLDIAKETFMGTYILEPGDYKIKVKIAANNMRPKTKIFNLKIKEDIRIERNRWSFEEEQKLIRNILISIH